MKLRVTIEIEAPEGATHYSGEPYDEDMDFYKMTQVGAVGDHWWRWDDQKLDWFFIAHSMPKWVKSIPVEWTGWKLPAPADREEGLEVLAFHRGKWRHAKWTEAFGRWSLGAGTFIMDGDRAFAPVPDKPEGADGFYDWRG